MATLDEILGRLNELVEVAPPPPPPQTQAEMLTAVPAAQAMRGIADLVRASAQIREARERQLSRRAIEESRRSLFQTLQGRPKGEVPTPIETRSLVEQRGGKVKGLFSKMQAGGKTWEMLKKEKPGLRGILQRVLHPRQFAEPTEAAQSVAAFANMVAGLPPEGVKEREGDIRYMLGLPQPKEDVAEGQMQFGEQEIGLVAQLLGIPVDDLRSAMVDGKLSPGVSQLLHRISTAMTVTGRGEKKAERDLELARKGGAALSKLESGEELSGQDYADIMAYPATARVFNTALAQKNRLAIATFSQQAKGEDAVKKAVAKYRMDVEEYLTKYFLAGMTKPDMLPPEVADSDISTGFIGRLKSIWGKSRSPDPILTDAATKVLGEWANAMTEAYDASIRGVEKAAEPKKPAPKSYWEALGG